jgi:lactoylglutathione lyase
LVERHHALTAWLTKRHIDLRDIVFIGMSLDDPSITPSEHCRYDLGIAFPREAGGILREIVRSRGPGPVALAPEKSECDAQGLTIRDFKPQEERAWHYLYRVWLPSSGFVPADLPAMELFVRLPEEIGWQTFVSRNLYTRRAVLITATAAIPDLSRSQGVNLAGGENMKLGTFSVSLAVKDLEASKTFYEKLGFRPFAGDASRKYLILKNGDATIGLFQGMFDKNILTFNPGWDSNAKKKAAFTDVREIQRELKSHGVQIATPADETTKGPASFVVIDPDGNPILVDQHI